MIIGDIYCDMDGVVVDFLKGVKEQTGFDWKVPSKDKIEKRLRGNLAFESGSQFWINLPPMHDYADLWRYISPKNPYVLTAVPRGFEGEPPTPSSIKYAKEGKWIWSERYLVVPYNRFKAVLREEKQLFATCIVDDVVVSNVLIDDHAENIKEWNSNRGIGILHTSAEDTIRKLKQLGI